MTLELLIDESIDISTLSDKFYISHKRKSINIKGNVIEAFELAIFLTKNNHLVSFSTRAHNSELIKLKEHLEKNYEFSLSSENKKRDIKWIIRDATYSILKNIYEENNGKYSYDDEG